MPTLLRALRLLAVVNLFAAAGCWLPHYVAVSAATPPARRYYDTQRYYALEHVPGASGASLKEVAAALGVEVVEQAGELEDVWLVRVPKAQLRRGLVERDDDSDDADPVIAAFDELQQKAEWHSSHLTSRSEESVHARWIVSSVNFLEVQTPQWLVKRAPPSVRPPAMATSQEVAKRLGLKDPLFSEQWHLVNDHHPEHMMNTTPVWDMGFTGKGILTSFLDDGLDFESEDLKDAFVSSIPCCLLETCK